MQPDYADGGPTQNEHTHLNHLQVAASVLYLLSALTPAHDKARVAEHAVHVGVFEPALVRTKHHLRKPVMLRGLLGV